jgi:tRNA threonylcarbamoyl adenosine modification protein (Sua5/YciO/YrdC/YwlC family)
LSQFFSVHPTHPQARLLARAADLIRAGGIAAVPTDTTYALVCQPGDKAAQDKIRRLRRLPPQHYFALLCADLSVLGQYAKVDNTSFRTLKRYTPGPFTFVLPATRDVPRRLVHAKRKTVGLRVPDHVVLHALLEHLETPLMTSTLRLPEDELPLTDALQIRDRLQRQIDLVIEAGPVGVEATTIVDLTTGIPELVRQGLGKFE